MTLRTLFALVVASAAMFVFAPSALAVDYCVGSAPGCSTLPYSNDATGFQGALDASNSSVSDDRIFLPPNAIYLGAGKNFTIAGSQKLEIIGAGSALTTFDCSLATFGGCLTITAPNTDSKISGFTIHANAGGGGPTNTAGLTSFRAAVSDVAIADYGGLSAFHALSLYYGAVADGFTIQLSSANSVGAYTNNSDLTARNCAISGGSGNHSTAISASGNGSTFVVDHCKLSDVETGVYTQVGAMSISDTLIDLGTHTYGLGLNAYNGSSPGSPTTTSLQAARLTIVGNGPSQRGLWLGAVNTNTTINATVADSVVYGAGASFTSLQTLHANPAGSTSMTLARSALNLSQVNNGGANPLAATFTDPIDLASVAPGFVNFAGGDYRPAAGSALIDRGSNTSVPLPGASDVAGATRIVDGNGDGVPQVDVGAYESATTTAPGGGATVVPSAKLISKPKKSFKVAKKGGFGTAKKGAASFSVQFTNSAKAKFTLKSIGKKKKLKTLKGSQTLTVKNSTVKFGFRGKWNKKQLKAGKYRVSITPLSSTGVAGAPVTVDIKLK
jgi:hypothetical protein